MVDGLVEKFGEFKKIVDAETGVAYKVPTTEVLERGLWREDLKKHPKWRASDDCIEVCPDWCMRKKRKSGTEIRTYPSASGITTATSIACSGSLPLLVSR